MDALSLTELKKKNLLILSLLKTNKIVEKYVEEKENINCVFGNIE